MRKLIRTDGTEEDLPHPLTTIEIEDLIKATALSTVNLRHFGRPLHVMVLDDLGCATKARKPVNEKATALYHANCIPGTTYQIVGDVVIVPDQDYDEGEGK